jgi:hypothetical protein
VVGHFIYTCVYLENIILALMCTVAIFVSPVSIEAAIHGMVRVFLVEVNDN